jgi:cellulose synthase/poly-beta-1,6-N-acetylglucosamine synthase-like glycosyltransferase
MTIVAWAYWICVAVIVYHHAIYPILLSCLARRHPPSPIPPVEHDEKLPPVTLIIPCHNEAQVIGTKIRNVANLDYPAELLSVVIALDGCTDETRALAEAAIAQLPQKPHFALVEYAQNIGKIAVLNEQIAKARSDIIALSDASALISSDALLKAAAHFARAEMSVVCATYELSPGADPGEQAYWRYQRKVKLAEAHIAAPMGAHGALYFFRRALWEPLAADTINDDFILPMRMVLRGYRAVYDQNIVATELEKSAPGHDFRRRIRIGAGNMQQLLRLPELCNPRHGRLALIFLSGKALRAMMPFILAATFLLSAVLAAGTGGIYAWLFVGKLTLVCAAMIGVVSNRATELPLFSHSRYALVGHLANGWGALQVLRGRHRGLWKLSTERKPAYSDPARCRPAD